MHTSFNAINPYKYLVWLGQTNKYPLTHIIQACTLRLQVGWSVVKFTQSIFEFVWFTSSESEPGTLQQPLVLYRYMYMCMMWLRGAIKLGTWSPASERHTHFGGLRPRVMSTMYQGADRSSQHETQQQHICLVLLDLCHREGACCGR